MNENWYSNLKIIKETFYIPINLFLSACVLLVGGSHTLESCNKANISIRDVLRRMWIEVNYQQITLFWHLIIFIFIIKI